MYLVCCCRATINSSRNCSDNKVERNEARDVFKKEKNKEDIALYTIANKREHATMFFSDTRRKILPPVYRRVSYFVERDVAYDPRHILARQIIDFWAGFPDAGEKPLPKRFDFHGPISWYRSAARYRLRRRYLSGLTRFNPIAIPCGTQAGIVMYRCSVLRRFSSCYERCGKIEYWIDLIDLLQIVHNQNNQYRLFALRKDITSSFLITNWR